MYLDCSINCWCLWTDVPAIVLFLRTFGLKILRFYRIPWDSVFSPLRSITSFLSREIGKNYVGNCHQNWYHYYPSGISGQSITFRRFLPHVFDVRFRTGSWSSNPAGNDRMRHLPKTRFQLESHRVFPAAFPSFLTGCSGKVSKNSDVFRSEVLLL
jgi:hypothetical protein